MPVLGRLPAVDDDVDDAGLVDARRCGSAARIARTCASTLSSKDVRHSSSVTSSNDACRAAPTLLTSTSRPPSRSAVAATARAAPSAVRQVDLAGQHVGRALRAQRRRPARASAGSRPAIATRGAGARQALADREPDAGGAAGDERAPTAETEVHGGRVYAAAEMPTLLCVRHGETDANRAGRWQGHDDQPLNATGRAQAERAAPELARLRIDAIVASDLARARESAAPLAALLGLPVEEREDLREIDVGSWAGLDRSGVRERDPEGARAPRRRRDGLDGRRDLRRAAGARRARAVERLLADHPDDATIAVFVHGGVIRAAGGPRPGPRRARRAPAPRHRRSTSA